MTNDSRSNDDDDWSGVQPHRPGDTPVSLDAAAAQFKPRIDGYELHERLGEGGMGTVWRATQSSTRRDVALKLMTRGAFSENSRVRFDREVGLTARLEHPHIARVYDSGLRHGLYFYAMELIRAGEPLDQYVRSRRLSRKQTLELMKVVALAVQHAHQRGVIHRDIKPSNIMVGADGQPHVLDFGLAKAVSEDGEDGSGGGAPPVSLDTDVLGTPEFMSPEQAAGRIKQIDTRTDVYSLGATLFMLLTGTSPHDPSGSKLEFIRRVAEQEPRRPRTLLKDIDGELEAILLKALARNPEDRYRSAGEFAQDIGNYLAGDPLLARKPTTGYFLRKRLRKHWLPLSALAATVLLLVGLGVFSYVRIAEQKREAERRHAEAVSMNETNKRVDDFLNKTLTALTRQQPAGEVVTIPQYAREVVRRLDAGSFSAFPSEEAAARYAIAYTLGSVGMEEEAISNLRKSLEIRRRILPGDHADLAATLEQLGSLLGQKTGGREEAESLLREAIAIRRRSLPAGEIALSANLIDLGIVLRLREHPRDAEAVDREALEIYRRSDRGDAFIDHGLIALGMDLFVQRRYAEAEPLFREIISRETAGNPHADEGIINHLTATRYLAYTLDEQGKTAEAEPLYLEAIKVFRDGKQGTRAEMAFTLLRYGDLLARDKRFTEAAPLHRESLDLYLNPRMTDYTHTGQALAGLTAELGAAGKRDEAIKVCNEAGARYAGELEKKRKAVGNNPMMVRCVTLLGSAYESAGLLDLARERYSEVLTINRKRFGADSPQAAEISALVQRTSRAGDKKSSAVNATTLPSGRMSVPR